MKCASFLMLIAPAALADPVGDMAAFEDCIGQIISQMPDHQHIDKFAPGVCGDHYFDPRQSCNLPEYIVLETREGCQADDLAFWRTETEWHETNLSEPRSDRLQNGIDHCTNYYERYPNLVQDCLTREYLTEALNYMGRPALAIWKANR